MIDRIGMGLCLALLFVWSLPGTVALRALLLLAALALLARRLAGVVRWRHGGTAWLPLFLIAALTFWFVIQATLISKEAAWAFGELRGQWLPALLALALGLALSRAQSSPNTDPLLRSDILLTAIFLVFGAQATIAVGHSLWYWMAKGSLLRHVVPLTGGKLEMSFVLNLLLAFLAVDLFCRATRRPPLLRLGLPYVLGIGAIALGCSYLAGARNGMIGIIFLSLSCVSLYIFDQRHKLGLARTLAATAAILAALGIFASVGYHSDPRWQRFGESARLAWHIDEHRAWLGPDANTWPRLSSGDLVEPSTYARVAFIRTGLLLIADHPLGIGYGRNAFGHGFLERYGIRAGHAHSGWIDLGIGAGWPALGLWATFLASLVWIGWNSFFLRGNAAGLVLFFLSTGYAGRMVLDSVNKDHMLQMFFFLVGVLLVMSHREEPA